MPSSSRPRTEAPPTRVERARPLLGTLVAIRIDATPAVATPALAAAFAAVEAVHRAMSFHDPDSQLSRLNREAALGPVAVGRPLWRVLRASLALARASQGRFDPTVGARLVQWGQLPAPDAHACDPHADWRDVDLLPGRQVRFRRRVWLDLGGIAKGHAVDRAVAALRVHGVRAGLVNAGGDLRVFGAAGETIHVRHPADPARTLPLMALRDGAAATSAGYFSVRDGRTALVDTRSGGCLGTTLSATVVAPRALWADALTKVVLADPAFAPSLLRRLGAQAALVDGDGAVRRLHG